MTQSASPPAVIDPHYTHPALAALYDLDSGWSPDRDYYLALAAGPPKRILDLGCGTGLLCDAYAARGHEVTGVDPAPAMLAVARAKPHGSAVIWIEATAQAVRAPRRYDLIVMTGHAFQALLTPSDLAAALTTIALHLAPGGRAVFESRNPALAWPERWDYDMTLVTPSGTVREARRFVAMDRGLMTFDLRYAWPDRTLTSRSTLRFVSQAEIEAALAEAGLTCLALHGDWQSGPFEPDRSEEMIFHVALA